MIDEYGMTSEDRRNCSILFLAAAAVIGYFGGRAVNYIVRDGLYNSRVQAIERRTDITMDHKYVLKQQAEEAYERPNPLGKHEAGAAGALVACAGLASLVLYNKYRDEHPNKPMLPELEKQGPPDYEPPGMDREPPPYMGQGRI